jgi:hypothetical protein
MIFFLKITISFFYITHGIVCSCGDTKPYDCIKLFCYIIILKCWNIAKWQNYQKVNWSSHCNHDLFHKKMNSLFQSNEKIISLNHKYEQFVIIVQASSIFFHWWIWKLKYYLHNCLVIKTIDWINNFEALNKILRGTPCVHYITNRKVITCWFGSTKWFWLKKSAQDVEASKV